MVRVVSANSGQSVGKPTPPVRRVNTDKWYKTSPPCEGGQGSNCDKRRIPIPGYENEQVPGGGPSIYLIQVKGTSIKVRWNRKHPRNRYPISDTIRIIKLPCGTHQEKHYFHSEGLDKIYPTIQTSSVSHTFHLQSSQKWESYEKSRKEDGYWEQKIPWRQQKER